MTDRGAPLWLVHIGYPKAASTLLQSTLFDGRHPGFVPARSKGARSPFLNGTGRDRFVPSFDDDPLSIAHPDPGGAVAVFSDEDLAGHPLSGGVTAPLIADRIKRNLPEARILIVVREQRAMCLSAYAHYLVRSCGRARLAQFLDPKFQNQLPTHHPRYYAFGRLVEWYVRAFGRDNVLVLPMETIVADEPAAMARIERFAGADPAPHDAKQVRQNRRDYREYAALRLWTGLNALGWKHPSNGYGGLGWNDLRKALLWLTKSLLPRGVVANRMDRDRAAIEAALAPFIPDDNARLQDYVEDDLAALGYMMPPATAAQS